MAYSNSDFRGLMEKGKGKGSSKLDTLDSEIRKELQQDFRRNKKAKKPKHTGNSDYHGGESTSRPANEPWALKHVKKSKKPVEKKKPKYRDRAAERKKGKSDFEEFKEVEGVDAEYTKFLGGEEKYTHLVKGLDVTLMQKTLREKGYKHSNEKAIEKAVAEVTEESKTEDGLKVPKFGTFFAESVYKLIVLDPEIMEKSRQKQTRTHRATFEYDVDSLDANQIPRIRTEKDPALEAPFRQCEHLDDETIADINSALTGEKEKNRQKQKQSKSNHTVSNSDSDDDDDDIFANVGRKYETKVKDPVEVSAKKTKQHDDSVGPMRPPADYQMDYSNAFADDKTPERKSKQDDSVGPMRPPANYQMDYSNAFADDKTPERKSKQDDSVGPMRPPANYQMDYSNAFTDDTPER